MKGKNEVELIAQLESILKPELFQELGTGDSFILEEPQAEREDTKIDLIGISPPFLAVHMNKLSHLSALRTVRDKWNQICDYLLIGQSNGSDYAILVELKATLGEKNEAKGKEQLLRSLPILKYLLSVCTSEYGSSGKSDLTIRCVLIAEKLSEHLNKQGLRVGSGRKLKQESYKSIKVATFAEPTVHFTALARG